MSLVIFYNRVIVIFSEHTFCFVKKVQKKTIPVFIRIKYLKVKMSPHDV